MDVIKLRDYETLSPFEIKDELIKLAKKSSTAATHVFLNAGRGNPNWIATRPREGFFLLGQFAITESKRVMDDPVGLGGMPKADGIAKRLDAWLAKHDDLPGADFLKDAVALAVQRFGFKPDAFVHELVDSIIGDNYPVPDRILHHNEIVTHEYLMWAMGGAKRPQAKFDLFAVEGGTAAMCYLFKSLKANRLIVQGDTIAIGTPIFTPYLEMPELEDYDLKSVYVEATQENRFQYSDEELRKLEDPKVKAFFLVNPGNPTANAIDAATLDKIVTLVKTKRPDLILLTDDVYGTFVEGFQSLMAALPENTIGVYSFSKYFGCTGWRLGVIALAQDNILDKAIQALPEDVQAKLDQRYGTLTLEPRKMKLIDRFVADSRDVVVRRRGAGIGLAFEESREHLVDAREGVPGGAGRELVRSQRAHPGGTLGGLGEGVTEVAAVAQQRHETLQRSAAGARHVRLHPGAQARRRRDGVLAPGAADAALTAGSGCLGQRRRLGDSGLQPVRVAGGPAGGLHRGGQLVADVEPVGERGGAGALEGHRSDDAGRRHPEPREPGLPRRAQRADDDVGVDGGAGTGIPRRRETYEGGAGGGRIGAEDRAVVPVEHREPHPLGRRVAGRAEEHLVDLTVGEQGAIRGQRTHGA